MIFIYIYRYTIYIYIYILLYTIYTIYVSKILMIGLINQLGYGASPWRVRGGTFVSTGLRGTPRRAEHSSDVPRRWLRYGFPHVPTHPHLSVDDIYIYISICIYHYIYISLYIYITIYIYIYISLYIYITIYIYHDIFIYTYIYR